MKLLLCGLMQPDKSPVCSFEDTGLSSNLFPVLGPVSILIDTGDVQPYEPKLWAGHTLQCRLKVLGCEGSRLVDAGNLPGKRFAFGPGYGDVIVVVLTAVILPATPCV